MRLQPLRARRGADTVSLAVRPAGPVRFYFLVPVYRELGSGNLAHLFELFRAQAIGLDRTRVVFLVNNSPEAAAEKNEAFAENQRTIAWLKEQPAPFAIDVVDLSTSGCERNMGKIRQAGVDRVAKTLSDAEKDAAVLIHLDADTYLPPHFLTRLSALYETYAALDTAFVLRDYELRGVPSPDLLFTHHRYRLRKALFDFNNARLGLPHGVATYQISSRLRAMEKVGGFRPIPEHEDTALTEDLCAATNWTQAAELELRTEDRTRPEGFNSQKRAKDLRARAPGRKGPAARLWDKLKGRSAWAPLAELKPAGSGEFFPMHALFHPLALELWEDVKTGRMTYAAATAELKARLEKFLGRKIVRQRCRLDRYSPAKLRALPDVVKVAFGGGAVLCPVAHPFSKLFVTGTLQPASEIWAALKPHLGEDEAKLAERALGHERAAQDARAKARRAALDVALAGEQTGDQFAAGLAGAGAAWGTLRTAITKGKLKPAEAGAALRTLFPDWLGDFDDAGFAKEVSLAKILTALLVRARALPKPTGLEEALALLQWAGPDSK